MTVGKRRGLTQEQRFALRVLYPYFTYTQLAEMFKIPPGNLRYYIKKMKLTKDDKRPWTQEEENILLSLRYSPNKETANVLMRTIDAIKKRKAKIWTINVPAGNQDTGTQ